MAEEKPTCPNCGKYIKDVNLGYCPKCGWDEKDNTIYKNPKIV